MYTRLIDMLEEFSNNYIDDLGYEKESGFHPDLIEFIEANEEYVKDEEGNFDFNNFIDDSLYPGYKDREILLDGDPISIEAKWGGEGDGAHIYKVLRWRDQLVQLETHYSSWDCTYWDSAKMSEVALKTVSVTRYVEVG